MIRAIVLCAIVVVLFRPPLSGQNYIFAQLTGSPVNTTGWNLQGYAKVGNITGTGNSEILLCPADTATSGAIFFNRPINLSVCNKWKAEFDFRMYDGTGADGLAFCFLDVPPSGYVAGGGLGIPATANGLKICFDTWNNCLPWPQYNVAVPKIEIRWGPGYGECVAQPTLENTTGNLSFIRSSAYNHARIEYESGNINIYVNDVLYLSGYQQFNFSGYLGFTASTGGFSDNHSIKNVVIYTEMPPSNAGNDVAICPGDTVQLGHESNPLYTYSWSPVVGLSNTSIADPLVSLTNETGTVLVQKYFVNTSFAGRPGCASVDSVIVQVNPKPATAFQVPVVCLPNGKAVFTNATTIGDGTLDQVSYLWAFSTGQTSMQKDTVIVYQAPGNYSVKLTATSVHGCADSLTQSFTIHPQATVSLSTRDEYCQDSTLQFYGSATSIPAIGKWYWHFGDNTTDTLQNPAHRFTTADTFTVRLYAQTVEGCSSDTVDKPVIINPLPLAGFAYSGLLCKNQLINFRDTSRPMIGSITNYTWSFDDGTSAGGNTTTRTYPAAGSYQVRLSVQNSKGCISKPVFQQVVINPSPVVQFLLPEICIGMNGVFTDTSFISDGSEQLFTYTWLIEGTQYLTKNATHRFNNPGNYPVRLKVTSGLGCTDSLVQTVAVSSYPVTSFAILTTDFCGNLPLVIQDNSSVQYASIERLKVFWNWPDLSDTSAFPDPVAGTSYEHRYESFGYQPQKQVNVKVQAYSSGGCFTEQVASSILFASPRLVFDPIPVFCSNISEDIKLTNARDTSSFSGSGFYYGKGIIDQQAFNPSVAGTGSHTITYKHTLVNGCFDSMAAIARVAPQPVVAAGTDVTILQGGVTRLNGAASGGNNITLAWTPPTGLSNAAIPNPEASPEEDTYYTLTATNNDACSNTDIVFVRVLKTPLIPNAFSPNGDGINDVWQVTYLNSYPGCVVEIFNRNGQRVFQSTGYSKPWDGTFNGKPLPVGTYYYIIDTKRITKKLAGYVTLLK